MPQADLGDLVMGYDDDGDGSPLLAIQGIGFARWGWSRQAPDLAKRFRFIAPDTRGIGGSPDPAGPASVAQLADDYLRLMDALGLERAHVMGVSAGGFIGLEMALRAPERIDRLVLVSTAAYGAWEIYARPTIEIFGAIGMGPEANPDPTMTPEERVQRFTRNMFSEAFADAHPEMLEQVVAWRAETAQPPQAWLAHSNANLAYDRRDRLGEIAAPTLVAHGGDDRVVRPEMGRALAADIPDARFELLSGGGHVMILERPEEFNALVTDFLEGR